MQIFWSKREDSEVYTVLPSGNCVFGIQVSGRLRWKKEDSDKILDTTGVTGILTEHRKYSSLPETKTLLVSVSPLLLSAKLRFDLTEIKNQSLSLFELFSREKILSLLADCEEESALGGDGKKAWARFWDSLPDSDVKELFLPEALRTIREKEGEISVRSLSEELGISQSTLERGFKRRIGLNPKEYANLVRFRKIFDRKEEAENLTDLAYRSGYYDQAHFIREFRKMAGVSPKEWFSKERENLKTSSWKKKHASR